MSHKSNFHGSRQPVALVNAAVVVRDARPEDEAAIRRIALLDNKRVRLAGRVLVAEVDGEIIAALPVGGAPVADPFRWTSDVVALLEMRASQIQAATDAPTRNVVGSAVRAFPRIA